MEASLEIDLKARITLLDVIRGFSILGILLMNIQSFSMIGQAYNNPTAFSDLTGVNKWVWIFSHIIADQKFLSIFSMMFGASIIMIAQDIERKGQSSVRMHYTRNFWLLIIGLLHAYLIWYGDILAPYAVCSFLVFPFRKLSPKVLFITGILVFSINSIGEIVTGLSFLKLSNDDIQNIMGSWSPNVNQINQEVHAYLGSYSEQLMQRVRTALMMHTYYFPHHYFWRVSGLMLIGMSIFKSGFLTGNLDVKIYKRILKYVGTISFFLVVFGLIENFKFGWSIEYSMFFGSQFNYWGSFGMAFAYISGLVLICRSGRFTPFTKRMEAIGRTALSNYILQSLICTSIFYGFGLGLFGQVERIWQLSITMMVWTIQIYLSMFWIKCFKYGPMEWIWRSLTLGKIQNMHWSG